MVETRTAFQLLLSRHFFFLCLRIGHAMRVRYTITDPLTCCCSWWMNAQFMDYCL